MIQESIELPNAKERDHLDSGILPSAAWALVVSEHTGSRDTVFGTTRSGRDAPIPGIELVAGPTISTFNEGQN